MGARGPLKKMPTLAVVPDGAAAPPETTATLLPPSAPIKPDGLPERASDAWDLIVPVLDEAGLLSTVDGPALELAVRAFAISVLASDTLLYEGVTVPDEKNGREAKHPAAQVSKDQAALFLEFSKQFGLTWMARARSSMPTGGTDASQASNPWSSSALG